MASRFSLAPLGDPGKVTIRVCFLTPATGLAIMATVTVLDEENVHGIKRKLTWCDE